MRHIYSTNVDCANCARSIEEMVNSLDGIDKACLVFVEKKLIIDTTKEGEKYYAELEEKIRAKAGLIEHDFRMWTYEKEPADGEESEKGHGMLRIAVSAAFVVFGLLLEFVLDWEVEGWDFAGIMFRLLFLAGLLISGYEVIITAARNLAHVRFLDENFLMTAATIGALLLGEYPESVAIMMFYRIGEMYEERAVRNARNSVKAMMNLKVPFTTVVRDTGIISIRTEEVQVGDTIIVKPGDMVPVDGVVLSGKSFVDTKAMTGEPVPRRISSGDEVLSGFINTDSAFKMRATRLSKDSSASKVLELIEDSLSRKSSSERFITKFARYYTPAVVFGALALSVIPSLIWGDWAYWIEKGLIFLVVSCPCALVVSVPLTYFCGIGSASRRGILIKGSNYIETLSKAETAVFDKTGTLTKGEFVVNKVEPVGITEQELIAYAASAEAYSTHPIAKSICRYAGIKDVPDDSECTVVPGKGISSEVGGRTVCVGNRALMESLGISDILPETEIGTHVHVAVDGVYAGHILISDNPKEDAAEAVKSLKDLGVKTHMLTGDGYETAKDVSEKLGLDGFRSELLPSDKTSCLEKIISSAKGCTVFVGDGINDAPSLARADVGIAMGGFGSDAAVEVADLVIMDDKPSKVAESIRISRKTQSIVLQNIVFALAVKFAILGLTTFTGYVSMWVALFGDVGVLILAVLNATRAMRGIPNDHGHGAYCKDKECRGNCPETCHCHGENCTCED